MKCKTVGVVLGVLALMAFAITATAATDQAELAKQARAAKGYPEEEIGIGVKAPEGYLEATPLEPIEGLPTTAPSGYEIPEFIPMVQGTVSTSRGVANTWIGECGTTDTLDISTSDWFKYIMYKGEKIKWFLTPTGTADYDIEIYDYDGNLMTGSYAPAGETDSVIVENNTGDQLYIYVRIHHYAGDGWYKLRHNRVTYKHKPIYLSNYAFTDWGWPTNGLEGTFDPGTAIPDTHFYLWKVPSYFHFFKLQVTGVCTGFVFPPPYTAGLRVEIWNDCNDTLLDSVTCGPDSVYPDTLVGIQGWADSVLCIKVINQSPGATYKEYRIDYNTFTEKLPDICIKPNFLDVEINKGQERCYEFIIENCGTHLEVEWVKTEYDTAGIITIVGATAGTLAVAKADTDTVCITAPTTAGDYYGKVIVTAKTFEQPFVTITKELSIHLKVPDEHDAKPDKWISQETFYKIMAVNETAIQTFTIGNNADQAKLHWYIDPDTSWAYSKKCGGVPGPAHTWLRISPNSGVIGPKGTQVCTLYFDSDLLGPGEYVDTCILYSDDPDDQEEQLIITLKVKAPNKLLDPTAFDDSVKMCNTMDDILKITNDGNTMLTIYKITWDPYVDWLKLDKTGPIDILPGDYEEVTLTFDSHGICCAPCSTCTTKLLIESNDPYCPEPETVEVKLTIYGAKVACGPQEIHVVGNACIDSAIPRDFWICNIGCLEDLEWNIDTTKLPDFIFRTWLPKYPPSGVIKPDSCDTFQIVINLKDFAPGDYLDSLHIANNSWNDPDQTIPIFVRAEGAVLRVDPTTIEYTCPKGKVHEEVIKICNDGNISMPWTMTGLPAWITASATSGTVEPRKCHDVTLTFDSEVAGPDTSVAKLTVKAPNAYCDTIETVSITLIVLDADWTVSPDQIHDSLVVGETATHTLTIESIGDQPLQWSVTEHPWALWVDLDEYGGTIPPAGTKDITLTLDADQLKPCSTYEDTLIFQTNSNTKPSDSVYIFLTVGKPEIYLSTTSLSFGPLQPCEGATETKTFIIQNDGPHIPLKYTITECPEATWLTVTPTSGTLKQYEEDEISVKVEADDLPAGTYETDLCIASNDPDNPEVKVHVTMTIHAAWVDVSPSSFEIHIAVGKTKDTMLIVTNSGDKASPWEIQTTAITHWLSISPDTGTIGGGETDTIELTFDATGVSVGTYSATLVFEASEDRCSPKDIIPVTMVVEAPDIAVVPDCFYITLGVEESMDTTFTICNEGAAELNVHSITHSTCTWLTVKDTTYSIEPTDCVTHNVHFYTGLLGLGTYSDTIVITSNDPDEPTVEICVTLEVVGPKISVTTTSIAETLAAGEKSCEATFGINNEGDRDLEWLISENPYVSWLSEDPITGTTAPSETTWVTVCFDGAELAAGTTDTTNIVITSNDVHTPTVPIEVIFTVTSTKLAVNPGNVEIGMNVGDSMDKTFEIRNPTDEILTWSLACKDAVDWLTYPRSGAVNPGETDLITIHFDASNLANGTYETTLTLTTSDNNTIDIPVKLIVSLKGVEERGLPEVGTCEAVYLSGCLPNPFASKTSFVYGVPSRTHVSMKVYDCTGKEVKTLVDATVDAGYYKVTWDGTDNRGNKLVSGIYFYRLTADGTSITKKLILLR